MSCKIFYNGEERDQEELGDLNNPSTLRPLISKVRQQGEKIKKTELEDGSRYYTNTETNSEYIGISDDKDGKVGDFRFNVKERTMSWEEKLASVVWGKEDKATKLNTDEGYVDYDTFIQKKQKRTIGAINKGNLFHAIFEQEFSTLEEDKIRAAEKIDEIKTRHRIPESMHDWLYTTNRKRNTEGNELRLKAAKNMKYIANALLKTNIKDDGIKPEDMDRILMEVKVASEELGIAGTVDALIEHSDGYLSLVDFKAGSNLNRIYTDEPLMFGRRAEMTITDNPRHRAKLQLMLYALVIKINNPEAKFRRIAIAHVADEFTTYRGNNRTEVEVAPFLGMMEDHFKSKPEIWAKLMALPHFKTLFDPTEYSTSYSPELVKSIKTNGNSPSAEYTLLTKKIAELTFLTTEDDDFIRKGGKEFKKARHNLNVYMKQIQELASTIGVEDLTLEDGGMSYMSTWFGNIYDSTDPYIKMIRSIKSAQEEKARQEYTKVNAGFVARLKPVYEQYMARTGNTLGKIPVLGEVINFTKYKDLYDFMYKEVKNKDGDIIRIDMNSTKEDFDNFKRTVSKEEREFAKYINDYYREWFSPDSYFMKKSIKSIDPDSGTTKNVSPMDIQNGIHGRRRDKVGNFKWYEGWMPKFARTFEEVKSKSHPYNSTGRGSIVKEVFLRGLTFYYENTFDEWGNTDEIIPMKGLGSNSIDQSLNYTLDINEQFTRFAKAAIYKKHMDQVYGFTRATKLFLQMKSQQEEMPALQNNVKFIQHILDYQLLGKRQQKFGEGRFVKSRLLNLSPKNDGEFSVVKLIQSMKNLTSGALMWLATGGGLANGTFAYMITLKKALSGSIAKRGKAVGLSNDAADFTLKHLLAAHKDYKDFLAASMTNKLSENKVWLLMQKTGFMPSFNPFRENRNSMLATRNKGLSSDSMYAFYSMPEEFVSTIMMVAQMRALKTTVNGEEKSVWDLYDVVKTNKPGEADQYEVQWRRDAEDKPIVRGTVNISKDPRFVEYKDITELTHEEIDHMKYVYQTVHGGYRRDEHTMMEYYVVGSAFTQFRRYLPSILRNMAMSKGTRALGKFVLTEEEAKDGKKVMEWRARVSEGRFMLLTNLMLSYLGANKLVQNPTNGFTKYLNEKFTNLDDYKWSKLSEEQRAIMLDVAITWGTWAAMYLGYLKLFKDADDSDEWKRYASRILKDYHQQYNIGDVLRMAKEPPVSAKMTVNFFTSLAGVMFNGMLYLSGDEENSMTKTGKLKYITQLENNTVLLRGVRQTVRAISRERDVPSVFGIPWRK